MTATASSRTVRRLVVDIDGPFDEFRAKYERAVPAYDISGLDRFSNWDDVRADADRAAPNGFLRYATIDASPAFGIAGHKARSVTYLMGNHTIAETMYAHDAGIMLYAPLRTVLYEDLDGHAHFAVDQPSDQFGSFGDADIAATGKLLDEKLAALLTGLGVSVPDGLA
ncbi:MAG TPA: hypothetical protein VEN99_05460 [Acidimicrobiia bacterium]|nr:hypothetical protein [Acidimicrobiia bacterium]